MQDWMGPLFGAGAGLIGGMLDRQYQEGMVRENWAREDNAVQRRAADLEAAGFNRTLAVGGAASTSAPMGMTRLGESMQSGAQLGMAAAQMKEQISNTRAQRELIKAQTNKTNNEAQYLGSTMNDRQLLVQLKAKFEDQMFETRRSILTSGQTMSYSKAMIANAELQWKEAYGEQEAEAKQLLATTEARIMQEFRVPYEQARAMAMKHNAEFMKKNVDWYWFNHTAGPAIGTARTVAPFIP